MGDHIHMTVDVSYLTDLDRCQRGDQIEQLGDVRIAHPYAAMGTGPLLEEFIRGAVYIYVASHAVAGAQAVEAGLLAGQPEDAGQDPVPPRLLLPQFC
jgi:hypothetical protein